MGKIIALVGLLALIALPAYGMGNFYMQEVTMDFFKCGCPFVQFWTPESGGVEPNEGASTAWVQRGTVTTIPQSWDLDGDIWKRCVGPWPLIEANLNSGCVIPVE